MQDESLVTQKNPFEAYRGDAPYVFVSYSHQDTTAVYPELLRLRKLGFNVWYDEGISPGSHWSDELAERINNCALFLFLVTPRSVASRNCLDEANYVLDSNKPFLAVQLEETDLPHGLKLRMGSRQAILRRELEPLSYESKLYAAIAGFAATSMQAETNLNEGFRLGPFSVEPLRGSITGPDGESQHLEPKVMDVFVCLARHANELITREQLLDEVWTGQIAADELLTRAVSELRRVLGDTSYIETVPKRGYRLVGEIQPVNGSGPDSSVGSIRSAVLTGKRQWTYAGVVVVVLAIAVLTYDRYRLVAPSEPQANNIAVLPFENLSGNPEQEYFVDGIHGEVITTLGRIGALTVISRTSVMQYKDDRQPLPIIAADLNVSRIVEGTVRRAGNQVSVSVQLIDALSDQVLWAKSYDRELSNILALQSDVARAISDEIWIELSPEERAYLADAGSVAPDAYDAYLKGSYILNKGLGPQSLKAVRYLEQSIEADPTFAPAHAALVLAYINDLVFITDELEKQETITKMRAVAQKMMELDRTIAEAHAAIAAFEAYWWDWEAARAAFERALELNPNLEVAHRRYAVFLTKLGHLDEALIHINKAHRLAPLSPGVNRQMGWIFLWRAEFEKAINQFKLVLDMDPENDIARHNLKWGYAMAGMAEQLRTTVTEELTCSDLNMLAWAYAARGQHEIAAGTYNESVAKCPLGEDSNSMDAGFVYVFRHDEETALELLRQSYERREQDFVSETSFPWWDPLRERPEFKEMMKESGLDKAAKPISECQSCGW